MLFLWPGCVSVRLRWGILCLIILYRDCVAKLTVYVRYTFWYHDVLLIPFDVMAYFLIAECTFWCNKITYFLTLTNTFLSYNIPFQSWRDVLSIFCMSFLKSWRTFWRHDVLSIFVYIYNDVNLTSWPIFYVLTYLWCHYKRSFWDNDVFLMQWCTFHTSWDYDIPVDTMLYFLTFDTITYFLMLWRTFWYLDILSVVMKAFYLLTYLGVMTYFLT